MFVEWFLCPGHHFKLFMDINLFHSTQKTYEIIIVFIPIFQVGN